MDKRIHSGQSYRKDGRPALTVIEGGRERTDSPLLTNGMRRKLGAFASIGIAALGVGMMTSERPSSGLACDGTQPIPEGYASQSQAVAENVAGIVDARQLGMVPVTTPDGSTRQYSAFMPNGAPEGSSIPESCN